MAGLSGGRDRGVESPLGAGDRQERLTDLVQGARVAGFTEVRVVLEASGEFVGGGEDLPQISWHAARLPC